MGNENSTTTEEVPKKPYVPGSSYPNYPRKHRSKQPPSVEPTQKLSSIPNKEPSTSVPKTEQSSPSVLQKSSTKKPASPIVIKQQVFLPSTEYHVPSQNISNYDSLPHTATASSFEKAPMIQLNYVLKSSGKNSMQIYDSTNMTVMRRTSSQSIPQGYRWYDNDYNKPTQPLAVKYP